MITIKAGILAIALIVLMPLAMIPFKSPQDAAPISVNYERPPVHVRGSVLYKTGPDQLPSQGKTSLPKNIFDQISRSHLNGPHQIALQFD